MKIEGVLSFLKSPTTNLRLLYVFSYASGTAWIPFFGLFLKDKGLQGSEIGYISGLIWIVMLVFQPLWGLRADKLGRVLSFRIAVTMTAIMLTLFFLFGASSPAIIVLTLGSALFYIAILPLLDTLVLDHVAQTRTNIKYGDLRFWGAVGASLGAQTSSLVIDAFPTRAIFIVAAVYLVLAIPFSLRLKIPILSDVRMKMEFSDLRPTLKSRTLVSFLMLIAIVSVCQTSIWYYLPIYLTDIGATNYVAGLAITIDGISELPFYFLVAVLFRNIGIRYTILLAFLATSLRLFLYSINDAPIIVLLIETLNGLSWTLLWVSAVELVNLQVKAEWRATGQSLLWAAYYGAGQILGNIYTGHLYEHMSMKQIYGINSVVVLVATALGFFIFYGKHEKHHDLKPGVLTDDNNGIHILNK